MSLSGRGARRPPADPTVSTYVRTLDVYPVHPPTAGKPAPTSAPLDTRPTVAASSPSPAAVAAAVSGVGIAQTQPRRRHAATIPAKAGSSSSPSPPIPTRTVTEEDYRLSPQEVQRAAQERLAAQVGDLLAARLQQRLQQLRLAEEEQAAEARRQTALQNARDTTAAAAAAASGADVNGPPLDVRVTHGWQGGASTTAALPDPASPITEPSGSPPLPFTTARLVTPGTAAAPATATPPLVDPAVYDVTLDSHPYSAIELVRVHRLKGIAHHNRGLFAGLAKRSYTTRSGHLVVNPDLAGTSRVRSAVSSRVWEQQQEQHQQLRLHLQQLQQQRGSSHHDAASSSVASPSRNASSNRMSPPRLVMKVVVGEGNQASFMWAEEDSQYDAVEVGSRQGHGVNGGSAHSLATPLSTAVSGVLDQKYGRPLTEPEKAEAERRLRARRQREQASSPSKQGGVGSEGRQGRKPKGTRVGSGGGAARGPSSASANSVTSSTDATAAVMAGETPSPSPADGPLRLHNLLPSVLERNASENGTLGGAASSGGGGRVGAGSVEFGVSVNVPGGRVGDFSAGLQDGGPLSIEGNGSLHHGAKNSSFNGGGSGGDGSGGCAAGGGSPRSSAHRAGLSVSELEHTMSVHEAEERQKERHGRAEHVATTTEKEQQQQKGHGGTATTGTVTSKVTGGSAQAPASKLPAGPSPSAGHLAGGVSSSSSESDLHTGEGRPHRTSPPGRGHRGTAAVNAFGDLNLLKHSSASLASSKPPRTTPSDGADGEFDDDYLADFPGRTGARTRANKPNDGEHKQLDTFLEHFPEAESHVRLRRAAKNILAEFEDLWDEDGPMSERPFPLPQFANLEFQFPRDDDEENTDDDPNRRRQRTSDQPGGNNAAAVHSRPPEAMEEPVVGFDIDAEALQAKFRVEATEDCADLAARRNALLAEVVAQRQLVQDFADDVHFLSVGCTHNDLTAEQYAIELTRDVNVYARQNHLHFIQVSDDDEALREQRLSAEEQERAVLGFLERFGRDRVATRDVGCQVSDADLCYVDAAVRSTEVQLESLVHHEKALLNAVRLATVAVANILSFHASLEMESTCHECFFVFDKPRTLWPCGHTFCHACLANMYNSRGDLICGECGSIAEVGYTPNMPMELIANYQTVYTRADADTRAAANTMLSEEKDAQTIEGVLRSLLNDLLATQHSWKPAGPQI